MLHEGFSVYLPFVRLNSNNHVKDNEENMNTDQLAEVYQTWCKQHTLEPKCAEELMAEITELEDTDYTNYKIGWLDCFIAIWDVAKELEA